VLTYDAHCADVINVYR